jgi:hypothetical protein
LIKTRALTSGNSVDHDPLWALRVPNHDTPLGPFSLALFNPQTLIGIQRMVKALGKNEIKWPSEEEWQDLFQKFNPLQPPSLPGCISVIGRPEFQIRQPSMDSGLILQIKSGIHSILSFWMGPSSIAQLLTTGSSDQTLWNECELQKKFVFRGLTSNSHEKYPGFICQNYPGF